MPRAASLAQQILEHYGTRVESFTLIPSGGGVYEFVIDGQLRFSKKSLGRFPEDKEIFQLIDGS
ncbi:MAG: Rdx family protein [Fidelibacterota bacterium]|nr:MAG: Rdx family protein [Candidatus Neomarinimicrobiota bacterium]